jgi:hypothetical protein
MYAIESFTVISASMAKVNLTLQDKHKITDATPFLGTASVQKFVAILIMLYA